MNAPWHLYIVRTRDDRLYTGIATDVERRIGEHGSGARGAKFLRGREPLELVFSSRIGSRALALRVEHQVKRLKRPGKERLIRDRPRGRELLRRLRLDEPDPEADEDVSVPSASRADLD